MQARKEKFMQQVRNELALNGAQELINVRVTRSSLGDSELLTNSPVENQRKVLRKMHNEAQYFVVLLRGGVCSPRFKNENHGFGLLMKGLDTIFRRVFRGVWIGTWKLVRPSALYPCCWRRR